MSLFGGLINPKLALNMVRKALESQFKEKIDDFSIIYYADKNIIKFFVKSSLFDYDNPSIKNIIRKQIDDTLKKGQILDFVKIDVKTDSIIARVYYIEGTKKEFVTLNL
jgi:hypothetical protein